MTYTFQQGETVTLALDVTEGSTSDVTQITGKLRQSLAPHTTTDFTIVPHTGGWNLVVAAATTENLAPGYYTASARLVVGGAVVIADPVQVHLKESDL